MLFNCCYALFEMDSEKIEQIIVEHSDEIKKIIETYSYGFENEIQNYCDDANSMLHRLFVKLGYTTDNEYTQALIDFINNKVQEKTEPF